MSRILARNCWVGAAVAAVLSLVGILPAHAAGPNAAGHGTGFALLDGWDPTQSTDTFVGDGYDQVFVGDWTGTGRDTLATRQGNTMQIWGDLTAETPTQTFNFGTANAVVLAGDWDGDGTTTFGTRANGWFRLSNVLTQLGADQFFQFGNDRALVLVGDFFGTGHEGVAIRVGNLVQLRHPETGSVRTLLFGESGDAIVAVGDWDGDGLDTPLVRRGNTYLAYNSWDRNAAPAHEIEFGANHDAVVVGDWDGDGKDTLGVRVFNFQNPGVVQVSIPQTTAIVAQPDLRLRADAESAWERVSAIFGQQLPLNGAWRSYETQQSIFEQRYEPQASGGGDYCDVRTWNGIRYVRTSNLGPAAIPGTSNHGAGLSVDVDPFVHFNDELRLRFLSLARDFGWGDDEGCLVGEPWHLTYYPNRDTGSTNWTPNDPVDPAASNCPNADRTGAVVPPAACPYN